MRKKDLPNRFGKNKMQKVIGSNSALKTSHLMTLYESFEMLLLEDIYVNDSYEKYVYLELSETHYFIKDNYYLSITEIEKIIREIYLKTDYASTTYDDYGLSKSKDNEIKAEGMRLFFDIFNKNIDKGLYYYSKLKPQEVKAKKELYKEEKKEGVIKETTERIDKSNWLTDESKTFLKEGELNAYYYRAGELLEKIDTTLNSYFNHPSYIEIKDDRGGILEERYLQSGELKSLGDKILYPVALENNILYYIDIQELYPLAYEWMNKNINICMNKCLGQMLLKQPRIKGFHFGFISYYNLPIWQDICYYIYNEILSTNVNAIKLPLKK